MSETWDKRETETNKAYSAFLVYRDMGNLRSLQKAANIFYGVAADSKSRAKGSMFHKWSVEHNWVSRCSDWDIEEERLRIEQKRKDIRKMDERQAKDGMELSQIGAANIKLHATYEQQKDDDGNILYPKMSVADATKLFVEGTKVERLARGEVTEISGHKGETKTILEVRYENEDEEK
jgi:hypothetical protein